MLNATANPEFLKVFPRILAKIKISTTSFYNEQPCWEWRGSNSIDGYVRFHALGEHYVHRISYLLFVGPIPEAYEVDHLCQNRGCFNPAHLEAVTLQVNRFRRNENTVWRDEKNTWVCKKGHRKEMISSGEVICKVCRYERIQTWRLRHPDKARSWDAAQKRKSRARRKAEKASDNISTNALQ